MQPAKTAKTVEPLRHVRIEQRAKTQISSEESQNWAVSYSDMLMVLMSFFILFFSFNEENPDKNLIEQISVQMGHLTTNQKSTVDASHSSSEPIAPSNYKKNTASGPVTANPINNIAQALKGSSVEMVQDPSQTSLIIHLRDQIYGKRQFVMEREVQQELKKVLEVLAPYKDQLQLTFIGHSDQLTIQNGGFYLASNLDLSSLRASRALSYAITQGYNPANLSIQAASDQGRNTRSLSIKVVR